MRYTARASSLDSSAILPVEPYARRGIDLSLPALNEVVKLGVFLVITITFQDAVSLADQTQ